MLIKNGNIFLGKNFVEGDIRFTDRIEAIGELDGPADLDVHGGYVIPGLVDIHTHGAMGEDFSDGKPEGLQKLADYYASRGVTSFLATTMTLPERVLTTAMNAIRGFHRSGGAKCAGVHLEGPFLSYAKHGSQAAKHLHKPDVDMFCRLHEASGGQVKMVSIAPEEEGAMEFIREVSRICTVSLGHTIADYDTAMAAFGAGASHVTHLFNGMQAFLHRAPGVIGAALDSGASVELICDGLHIHPTVVRATYRMFGEKLNLISDSLRCAGMADGEYELGGQPIVMKAGKATLPDGVLAGSSISLLDGVRSGVNFGLPLEEAIYAASTAPAMAAGLKAGRLDVGYCADLVVLDQDLNVQAVFVDGERADGRR